MKPKNASGKTELGRRSFMKSAGAASTGLLFVSPATAFGSRANSTLLLGMVGCGGRGTGVCESFIGRAGVRMHALGDLFQDQIDKARTRLDGLNAAQGHAKIDSAKIFKGPKAYQELAASDVDIVLVSTPPYFHPEHLEGALAARKHVYLEKPVATDVRGCKRVQDLAKKVEGKASVHVGFQIRYSPEYREMVRRIHEGAIGDVGSVQGYYLAGDLPRRPVPAGASASEAKLRNWFFDRVLSGDILVEQNVHIIDWINWTLKARPEKAYAVASRKVRVDVGDVNDHFVTVYHYPGDVHVGFQSTQYLTKWADVAVRFLGSKGYAEAHYSGGVFIAGASEWKAEAAPVPGGQRPEVDPLSEATPEKVKSFVESIKSGQFQNQLAQGAESTLSAILGRQAAYEGKEMTWDQLLRGNQQWKSDVDVEKLT